MGTKPDFNADARNLFRVKLSNFGHVKTASQRMIVADYRQHLAAIIAHSDAMAQEVRKASGLARATSLHLAGDRSPAASCRMRNRLAGWLVAKAGGTNDKDE